MVARRAHNPKVVGSSPASATKKIQVSVRVPVFFVVQLYFSDGLRGMRPTSGARWGMSPTASCGRYREEEFGENTEQCKRQCSSATLFSRGTLGDNPKVAGIKSSLRNQKASIRSGACFYYVIIFLFRRHRYHLSKQSVHNRFLQCSLL